MQPVSVLCRAPEGLLTPEVQVEVCLGPGLPGLSLVGLAETAVKESRDRVKAAIRSSGFEMPNRHIVVSLAPADLPKRGSRYDLAIAIGILCASGQLPRTHLSHCEFLGELSLAGQLRAVPGVLPSAMAAIAARRQVIVPAECNQEAALLGDNGAMLAASLLEASKFVQEGSGLPVPTLRKQATTICYPDLADVQGQTHAKRALEIAAVGQHHLLMTGPPGTGKSMLARRLPGLLPELSESEALETAAIHSLRRNISIWRERPFRAPHHSATAAALIGGGANPRPGEASLAHNGVLFLDELPEYPRPVLDMLREPLETGHVAIARAQRTVDYPARFQLVAAMNPCPCGYLGESSRECRCTPDQVQRYQSRVSGPLLDRIDLRIALGRERIKLTQQSTVPPNTTEVRNRIAAACRRITARQPVTANARLDSQQIRDLCWPDQQGLRLLETAAEKFRLSRRGCDRMLRVARSIADLDGVARIGKQQVAEALGYRAGLI